MDWIMYIEKLSVKLTTRVKRKHEVLCIQNRFFEYTCIWDF